MEKLSFKKKLFVFIVLVIVLIAVRSIYKAVKLERAREYAVQLCEEKGGYRTMGPVKVAGYKRKYSGFEEYAKALLVEGFQFIESQGVSFDGVHRTTSNPVEAYTRFTIEKRSSDLCKKFDTYWNRLSDEKKERFREMGLKDDECIGTETFLDWKLLKSEYEFYHFNERDVRVPAIIWSKTQVRHIQSKYVLSELAVFSGCLDGYFRLEPFYNGCRGGAKNAVMCPVNPKDWDFGGQVTRLFREAFVPAD